MNWTLLETAQSMLHHAQKPLKFWAEAVSTACYSRDQSPTIFLKNVTSYEHWYGKKPNVSNLKVFGCKAYVQVPDAKRKGNWVSCKWHKQYKCSKVMIVIFLEKRFAVKKSYYTQESFEFFTGLVGNERREWQCLIQRRTKKRQCWRSASGYRRRT